MRFHILLILNLLIFRHYLLQNQQSFQSLFLNFFQSIICLYLVNILCECVAFTFPFVLCAFQAPCSIIHTRNQSYSIDQA